MPNHLSDFITGVMQRFRCDHFDFQRPVLWLALALVIGCDLPQRPPLFPSEASSSSFFLETDPSLLRPESVKQPVVETQSVPVAQDIVLSTFWETPWETWESLYIEDQPIGYRHMVTKPVRPPSGQEDAALQVRYEMNYSLRLTRGGAEAVERLQQTSTETSDGQVIEFESARQVGPMTMRLQGRVSADLSGGNQLEVDTVRGIERSVTQQPWFKTCHGFMGVEQSLRNHSLLKQGEERSFEMLLSGSGQVATARLVCQGRGMVPMLEGPHRELAEISCEIWVNGEPTGYLTVWADEDGVIERSYVSETNMVAYRTTEAMAKSLNEPLDGVLRLPVQGMINLPTEATRVAYQITPMTEKQAAQESSPLEISAFPGQFVRMTAGRDYQVLVSRRGEQAPATFTAPVIQPGPEDLAASRVIDFDQPLVRRFASVARKNVNSKKEVALDLARSVSRLIELAEETGEFRSASEIAQSGQGGITARAVFLTALLRARGIPARLAFGLRYPGGSSGQMVYHVWTLAYADQQWINLDVAYSSERGGGIAPPERLTLLTSTLHAESEPPLDRLLDMVSRMKVRVLKAQY